MDSTKIVCSIYIYEYCNGYSYHFYNRMGKTIASADWHLATTKPYCDGDDLSALEVSPEIQIAFTCNECNPKSDHARGVWRTRLIDEEHADNWKKELAAYEAYMDSDDEWNMYGATSFVIPSPNKVKMVMDNYEKGGSDVWFTLWK